MTLDRDRFLTKPVAGGKKVSENDHRQHDLTAERRLVQVIEGQGYSLPAAA